MESQRIDLPQGTLDLLILKTLALAPQHGWGISERIQTSDTLGDTARLLGFIGYET